MAICGIAVSDSGKPLETPDLQAMTTALKMAEEDLCDVRKTGYAAFGTASARNRSSASSDRHIMVACDADLGSSAPAPNSFSACSAAATPTMCFGNGQINGMWQFRVGQIVGSTDQPNNNAAYVYAYTQNTGANQIFVFYANPTNGSTNTATTSCASHLGFCGTLYGDTPMVVDNNYGNNGGTYVNEFRKVTINCNFMPGCETFVRTGGEEVSLSQAVQGFNAMTFGFRYDQSPAYGAQTNGDTNDGSPNGPYSANLHEVQCQLGGGCACIISGSMACSTGTAPQGASMFCLGGNTGDYAISPDPCANSNYVGSLNTGWTGGAMPGFFAHETLSISQFQNGTGVPEMQGCNPTCVPGAEAVGIMVLGAGAHFQQPHEEYFKQGIQIGGDPAVSFTPGGRPTRAATSRTSPTAVVHPIRA